MATSWPKQRRLIGGKFSRLDGPEKSTGKAKYSFDINRPGMIFARMLRCPHAHAKVKSIDTAAAKESPGVLAVVTKAEIRLGVPTGERLRFPRTNVVEQRCVTNSIRNVSRFSRHTIHVRQRFHGRDPW